MPINIIQCVRPLDPCGRLLARLAPRRIGRSDGRAILSRQRYGLVIGSSRPKSSRFRRVTARGKNASFRSFALPIWEASVQRPAAEMQLVSRSVPGWSSRPRARRRRPLRQAPPKTNSAFTSRLTPTGARLLTASGEPVAPAKATAGVTTIGRPRTARLFNGAPPESVFGEPAAPAPKF